MNPFEFFGAALSSWWRLLCSQRPPGGIGVLSTQWSHHARRSGYHPVAEGLGMALSAYHLRLVPRQLARLRVGEGLDRAYQIGLALKVARSRRLLVVDGDFQLELIRDLRKVSDVRVFAVFHQVPEVLEERLREFPDQILDGAICVAECLVPLVQYLAPPGRTWFVPHGIDVDYFTPRHALAERPEILCVGCHCRDFETLRVATDLIVQEQPDASVRLVAPRSALPEGLDLGRVELLTGLSDEELLAAYQRAWVVLLPLRASTANNSLLEGMACGKPVVVTDVGGVRDYATEECGALPPPGDAVEHARRTLELVRDPDRRAAAGAAAREHAERCAWPTVRKRLREILDASGPV